MNNYKLLLLIFLILPVFLFAQDTEKEAIKKVIQTSYVDGLQNKGPVADIEAGFHPGFELLGMRNGELTKWPIYSWISYHEKKLAEDANPPKDNEKVTAKFPMVDVTGNAGIAKVELFRDGEKIFTDYLSLYKFEDGWKIVSKIYHDHREK